MRRPSGRWWGRPALGPPATIVSKLGPLEPGQLALVLHHAPLLDEAHRGHELAAGEELGVALLVGPGHGGRLQRDAGHASQHLLQNITLGLLRPAHRHPGLDAGAGQLLRGLVLVATVGHEHGRLARLQDQPRRAPGEAGEVADVEEVAHQQGVAAGLAEMVGDPADPAGHVHGRQAT